MIWGKTPYPGTGCGVGDQKLDQSQNFTRVSKPLTVAPQHPFSPEFLCTLKLALTLACFALLRCSSQSFVFL